MTLKKYLALIMYTFFCTSFFAALFEEIEYENELNFYFNDFRLRSNNEQSSIHNYAIERSQQLSSLPDDMQENNNFLYLNQINKELLSTRFESEYLFSYVCEIERLVLTFICRKLKTSPIIKLPSEYFVDLRSFQSMPFNVRFFIQKNEEIAFHRAFLKKIASFNI